MALQFNPPEWLIQAYQNRKQPAEIMNEGVGNAINTYAKLKQIQNENDLKKQQIGLQQQGNTLKAAEIGYDPNNPSAYWDTFSKKQKTDQRLKETQSVENLARADYYGRMPNTPVQNDVRQQKPPIGYRWTDSGDLEAITGGPADAKNKKDASKIDTTFEFYESARKGLLEGLGGTNAGPVMGRLPAITAAQQTAEGGVAAMAPALKQIFRVAGEGTFTDRDQALLLDMVPTRKDHPEAAKNKITNIDNIVRAKLGKSQSSSSAGGDPLGIR